MAAQSTTGTLTIAILDSDALAIQAICHNLSRIVPQSSILWHTPVSDLALQRCLSAEAAPDVFIVDMVLVDASVIAVCHDIRRATDSIGIIGLTSYDPHVHQADLAHMGIQALIPKARSNGAIGAALRRLAQGRAYDPDGTGLSDAATAHARLTDAPRPWQPLSEREDEVLQLFFQGKSTTQIAEELTVSRNTIYTHANRAMRELHARTRAEALAVWRKYAAPRS